MVHRMYVGWGIRDKPVERRESKLQPVQGASTFLPWITCFMALRKHWTSPRLTISGSHPKLQAKEQTVKPEQGKMLTRTYWLWNSLAMNRNMHGLWPRSIGIYRSVVICIVLDRVHLLGLGSTQYLPLILFMQWRRALAGRYFPSGNIIPRM